MHTVLVPPESGNQKPEDINLRWERTDLIGTAFNRRNFFYTVGATSIEQTAIGSAWGRFNNSIENTSGQLHRFSGRWAECRKWD